MKTSATAKILGLLALVTLFSVTDVSAQLFASKDFASAKLYFSQKQYDKAKEYIEKELSKNPDNPSAHYYKALIANELKDYKEMATSARKALSYNKLKEDETKNCNTILVNAWANIYNQGVNLSAQSKYDEAIDMFNFAINIMPDTASTYYNRFIAQYNSKKYDDAFASLDMVISKSHVNKDLLTYQLNILYTKARPYKSVADSLMSEFKTKKAVHASNKDKKKPAFSSPDSMDAAKQLKIARGEYDKALALLEKYNGSPYIETSWVLENKAQIYIESDRVDEALDVFVAAAAASPNNEVLQYNTGVLYFGNKNYDKAIEYFTKAVTIKPEYIDAVYNLGAAYLNIGVKLQNENEDAYNKEKNKKKKEAIAADTKHLEYFKKALPYLEQAQEAKKDDPIFWTTLGRVYTALKMNDKAKAAFNKAEGK